MDLWKGLRQPIRDTRRQQNADKWLFLARLCYKILVFSCAHLSPRW